MRQLVSVVIPTYNRASYIRDALESVFRQTFRDHEIIVVDDGSTDDTKQVLAPFMNRIRYLYQENRGEAAARNRGIGESRSEWIAFLDSDDMWEPQALETLLQAARSNPEAGLIAMRARAILPDGTRTGRLLGKKSPGPSYSTRSLLWGDSGGVLTPMIRRSMFEKVGTFDETLSSATDCDMWLRLSFHTQMICIQKPLLLIRVHEENLSGDKAINARMWLRLLKKLKLAHPEFLQSHPWTYRRALGKEHLRLGRELLATYAERADTLSEARQNLRKSTVTFPFFLRTYLYLLWSYLFPAGYNAWRRWERKRG